MDDCLPSERTCSLVSVIAPQTLLWTVHDKVSVHKWLRKRSRPSDGLCGSYSSKPERTITSGLPTYGQVKEE